MSLVFRPLIPTSLWLTFLFGGVALLFWYGLRRPAVVPRTRWATIVAFMGMTLGAVMLLLLNPNWEEKIKPPPGKPLVSILVDSSASMAATDSKQGNTRFYSAFEITEDLAHRLRKKADVRILTFSDLPSPSSVEELQHMKPEGKTTDLVNALGSCLQEDRPQGHTMLLLSDGIHNASGGSREVLDVVRVAKAMAVPIYARTLGGTPSGWDLFLKVHSPQALAYIGQRVPVRVKVGHRGLTGGTATVVLFHDGRESDRQEVTLNVNGPSETVFYVSRKTSGRASYDLRVEPMPGEATQTNNTGVFQLHVVDEPIRVLLLEGKPYWDTKFLMRTLGADPSIALDSVVRIADQRILRRTMFRAPEPKESDGETEDDNNEGVKRQENWKIFSDATSVLQSPESLASYQVLVLGRSADVFINEESLKHIREWIAQRGGSVVCYRGAPAAKLNQRLGKLMPVRWTPAKETRFRLRLTEQGRALQWLPVSFEGAKGDLLARLPSLASSAEIKRSQPLTVILATATSPHSGKEVPVISYQQYGEGRVVVIEGAGMWRWAFLPAQFQQKEDIYSALWQSLLRWLVSNTPLVTGQDVALKPTKVTFNSNESASATLLVRDELTGDVPSVQLSSKHLKEPVTYSPAPIGQTPGTYRIVFGKLPEGRYDARVIGHEDKDAAKAVFDVRSLGEEQLNLAARPDLMSRIASDSGGKLLDEETFDEIVKTVAREAGQERVLGVRLTTAWDRKWIMLLALSVWVASWATRRISGLI